MTRLARLNDWLFRFELCVNIFISLISLFIFHCIFLGIVEKWPESRRCEAALHYLVHGDEYNGKDLRNVRRRDTSSRMTTRDNGHILDGQKVRDNRGFERWAERARAYAVADPDKDATGRSPARTLLRLYFSRLDVTSRPERNLKYDCILVRRALRPVSNDRGKTIQFPRK